MDFEHILDDLYLQLNEVRLHPREAANRISKLSKQYNGKLFKNCIKTREGPQALYNLINDLNSRSPNMQKLKWSFALHMSADQQARLLGFNGLYTTQGTNFHHPLPERIKQHAVVKGKLSEVYQFGGKTPHEIIQQLLIDDGLTSRKRRNTLLDPIYNYIGIGCSYHENNEACTVIILAQDIISFVAPDKDGKYKRKKGIGTGQEYVHRLTSQVMLDNKNGEIVQFDDVNNPIRTSAISNPPVISNPPIVGQVQPSQPVPSTSTVSYHSANNPVYVDSTSTPLNSHQTVTYSEPNRNTQIVQQIRQSSENVTFHPSAGQMNTSRNTVQSMGPSTLINQPAIIQNQHGSVVTYEPTNYDFIPTPHTSQFVGGNINHPSQNSANFNSINQDNQDDVNRLHQEQYQYYKNQQNSLPTNTLQINPENNNTYQHQQENNNTYQHEQENNNTYQHEQENKPEESSSMCAIM